MKRASNPFRVWVVICLLITSFASGVVEETAKVADPQILVESIPPKDVEVKVDVPKPIPVTAQSATTLGTVEKAASEAVHELIEEEDHIHDEDHTGEDEHHLVDEHWVTDENGVAKENLDHKDEWVEEETAPVVVVGHAGSQRENDLWHALRNLKKLHHEKLEEHTEDLHELYEMRHQLSHVKEEYFKLERKLVSQSTLNEETVAANTIALLQAKEKLATCEKELSNTHAYAGQVVQDIRHEMHMKMKESVVRISELEKDAGYCSIVPPAEFTAAQYGKADTDHFADEAQAPTNFLSSFGSKVVGIFGGIFGSIHSVVISPLSSNAAAISNSAYNVAHPLASGVSKQAGDHWNNVVMPPYRAHVEPHVSKVTGSMQDSYDSYLKETVDAHHAYFWGTFVGTALIGIYFFFVSENLLLRIIGLPLTILTSLLGSFMVVVSHTQKIPGMQTIFGAYSKNAAVVLVTALGATLTFLLHIYVVDVPKLLLYCVTAPYVYTRWLFTTMLRSVKKALGITGKLPLDSKKSDIYGSSSNGYSDTNASYGSVPSSQYGTNHWNSAPSEDPRYSPMSIPPIRSSMISSDLRSRDDKSNTYYGSSISHSHSDKNRYSPPTAPGIRSSMSVDLRNRDEQPNRYYGSEISNTGSENSRHSISLTTSDIRPMMSRDSQPNKLLAGGVTPRMSHIEPAKPYFKNDTIDITDRRFSYRDNQSVTDDGYHDNA